jgi:hypothetical protein
VREELISVSGQDQDCLGNPNPEPPPKAAPAARFIYHRASCISSCAIEHLSPTATASTKTPPTRPTPQPPNNLARKNNMITDNELNSIAVFLGTLMMTLIVLYHFLAVNSSDKSASASEDEITSSGGIKKMVSGAVGAASPAVVLK